LVKKILRLLVHAKGGRGVQSEKVRRRGRPMGKGTAHWGNRNAHMLAASLWRVFHTTLAGGSGKERGGVRVRTTLKKYPRYITVFYYLHSAGKKEKGLVPAGRRREKGERE